MASGGAKTEILVDVETSPNASVAGTEPASVVKSEYCAIPEGAAGDGCSCVACGQFFLVSLSIARLLESGDIWGQTQGQTL